MNIKPIVAAAILISTPISNVAADASGAWFVRPYLGFSIMSDLDADFSDIDGLSGEADVELSDGFTGGLGVGYQYTDNIAIEFGWEYRSNDSETTLAGQSEFDDGNYASNIFYLNGHYLLTKNGHWQPYVGAGLTWAEEIDIDLERNGEEQSFSGDGDVGYQLFAGINYDLATQWILQGELRYGSITDIDLSAEGSDSGKFDGIDYETTTLQLGLVYRF